jgi:Ca2+-binding EF-hand superfamily protein
LKVASSELDSIINRAGYLKSGKLNYTEFLMATVNLKETCTDELITETFSHFDSKGKGYISKDDMHVAFKKIGVKLSDKEVNQMLSEYHFKNPD